MSEDADQYLMQAKTYLEKYREEKRCLYCKDSASAAIELVESLQRGKQDSELYTNVVNEKMRWEEVHKKTPELVKSIRDSMREEHDDETPSPSIHQPKETLPIQPFGFFGSRLRQNITPYNSGRPMPSMVIKQDGKQLTGVKNTVQKFRNSRPRFTDMLEDVF